jgi:hypothetical protein
VDEDFLDILDKLLGWGCKALRMDASLAVGLRSLLWLLLILSGSAPARSEFRQMPITGKTRCNLMLAAAADIPHTCWQLQNQRATLPVWRSALEFEFGQLTKTQWQQLQKAYAIWQKRPIFYDPQRHYTLMDFMPPLMQALNAHQFHAEQVPLPKPLLGLRSDDIKAPAQASAISNCWGTLYELLRTSQSASAMPFTFMTSRDEMEQWLQQQSRLITDRAQSGDILAIYHRLGNRTYLDHVALVVDEQILFEKAGTGDDTPYRLVHRDTLEQSWRPDIFTFEVRRPILDQPLSSPQKRFGLHSQQTVLQFPALASMPRSLAAKFSVVWFQEQESVSSYYYQIQPIHLLEVEAGRFVLSPSSSAPHKGTVLGSGH